ncbi:hypothetical protein [Dyadobacter fermentans]|uniref:PKD domain-containing protein n=1 Tax=Dyadobacter fermentans (strain ATCC 700827 / DSM 18053 / CIP 107007 / KCTC 52180 / NS114) TaxID=471854 RepID=C6VTC1_DYAFD|nr:hypothetical protein [Dyadobacter fermentans]ACT96485.1 hypothetical protein Dfer_5292 [Dyadobacter fermentans DSM 18053]
MTHLKKCDTGKLCLFLVSILFPCSFLLAQDYQVTRQKALDKLDLTAFGNVLFMNAAATTPNEINYLKNVSSRSLIKATSVTAEEWHNLYERVCDADLRPADQHMPGLEELMETNPSKLTRHDTVPIGIMALKATYLTDRELRMNEAQKSAGKAVDISSYNGFNIVYAAALQQDIYQADVWFRLSQKYLITNQLTRISRISIDFGDGEGFEEYSGNEQLVHHRYKTTGKHAIIISFKIESKRYKFETYVNVRQLDRVVPAMEFRVSAPAFIVDSLTRNARRKF